MTGPLHSVRPVMACDPGWGVAPGLAAHETNGPVVRTRAQMAGRERRWRRGNPLLVGVAGILVAAGVGMAAPSLLALGRSAGLVPVAHHDAFQVGRSGISVVGTYGDCTGRASVGWDGAYYDVCMGSPYWIGHAAILGAILSADRITYWDGAGAAHRWRVIGRRVLDSGSRYPGRLPGAVAELQTCVEPLNASSPVEIVDYA
jgi:hypothetical protein